VPWKRLTSVICLALALMFVSTASSALPATAVPASNKCKKKKHKRSAESAKKKKKCKKKKKHSAAKPWSNPSNTGVPAGWVPTTTRSTDLTVTTPGTVVQDVRFTNGADLFVAANNVTVRRVEFQGGLIDNETNGCHPGMLLKNVSMVAPDHAGGSFQEGAISQGGYTASRVKITGRSEGFRVSDCGPVTIEDSFEKIVPPVPCGDWHGDGIQGYFGNGLAVHNVTVDMRTTGCGGTSPFFYDGEPHNGNKGPVTVDRLLVMGQGFPFRLGNRGDGSITGSVTGLKVLDNSWGYGPVTANCPGLNPWEAKIVRIDANYQPTNLRNLPCSQG
jgi:hypothetical protein